MDFQRELEEFPSFDRWLTWAALGFVFACTVGVSFFIDWLRQQ